MAWLFNPECNEPSQALGYGQDKDSARCLCALALVMEEDFLDDESLFGVQLNDVAVCLIHRALKAYHDQWAGGDPWEQAEIKTLKDYFFTLMLEVTMDVDADRMP